MARHLDREIQQLKQLLLALSAVVEENLQRSVKALVDRDETLAREAMRVDEEQVDHAEVEVEEECLKVLALHQPVASDLRLIIAVLKINSDLERIGDMAVNIAERAVYLHQACAVELPIDIRAMCAKAQLMLKQSLDALVNLDAALALRVCAGDDEVDELNRANYEAIQARIRQAPDETECLMHYLAVSRHLERIADHATNIAEDVIYMVEGEIVRHHAADYRSQF
ncbi:MAG: phosphate signaling complex protein PhoU [Armatimonadetes bacterium]|nr:phosphate signaling complex protein PhoU [Armatimonadota bacterium]